ncbi:hypothetical protein EON65_14730 [archaeon]|nr:MAG: hypothetical protein EON65_14730 [archaeon]
MSRVKEELLDFKKAIDRALQSDVPEEERISDVLSALESVTVDLDLLKQTSMVQCLQSVKKHFTEADVGMKAKALLLKWKRDCSGGNTEDSQPSEDGNKASSKVMKTEEKRSIKLIDSNKKVIPLPSASSTPSLKASSAGDDEEWDDGYMKNLHPARQRVSRAFIMRLSQFYTITKRLQSECSMNRLYENRLELGMNVLYMYMLPRC